MYPSICQFISNACLTAFESIVECSLNLQSVNLPNEGIVMIPVIHEGRSQKSIEEGEVIKAQYQALFGQEFTDHHDGKTRPIAQDDIFVVTPYNVQVNYLRSIFPNKARVCTVDKFQGQEAPIVLISMVNI
ncbi:AAA domain-containing protein [Bartonella sp. F02]|uniref:AAA domain-containing protein n=1 Tax=Bartonella sp. F02 TaxID=2967262 RepID=UPI0022A971BA|nr:AAA domain-containing protein [Bartonella sp. F02]MCZ2328925.1 AAA domain-containing protein [Bartonella sp. F02]